MNDSLDQHSRSDIEELFRNAEAMAGSLIPGGYSVTRDAETKAGVSDDWLLDRALREAERLTLRRHLLPGDILFDRGWYVMLDLFVLDSESRSIELDQIGERWGLSEATAARQIAALIGCDLVSRQRCKSGGHKVTLRLTENGHAIIRKVLSPTSGGE